jgi:hypothetical protein
MTIATITSIARRELDQRVNGGLEITLFWNAYDNSTSIEIYHQETGETISFPVPADHALDAFRHPFAYLVADTAA